MTAAEKSKRAAELARIRNTPKNYMARLIATLEADVAAAYALAEEKECELRCGSQVTERSVIQDQITLAKYVFCLETKLNRACRPVPRRRGAKEDPKAAETQVIHGS